MQVICYLELSREVIVYNLFMLNRVLRSHLHWLVLLIGTIFLFLSLICKDKAIVELKWETASEVGTNGFNIFRFDEIEQNKKLIAFIDKRGGAFTGENYTFTDNDVINGHEYQYYLEEVRSDGSRGNLFGPMTVRAMSWSGYLFFPGIICVLLFLINLNRRDLKKTSRKNKASTVFSIGGCNLEFLYEEKYFSDLIQRYKNFILETPDRIDLQIEIVDENQNEFSEIPLMITPDINILHYQTKNIKVRIDFYRKTGEALVHKDMESADLEILIRIIFSILIFRSGGLLLHSAGIMRNEKAYIFMGHSGSGKTTITKYIDAGDQILSDDLIAIKPFRSSWSAFSTPFWNPTREIPQNIGVNIEGIYQINKSRKVFKEKMGKNQAIAALLTNTPVLTSEKMLLPLVIARCREIAVDCRIYELGFRKDNTFWSIITNN